MASSIADSFLESVINELKKSKSLAEGAIGQMSDNHLHWNPDPEANSVAIIVKHMAGNMLSRWTDFLTTDGEKPWRARDAEFIESHQSREAMMEDWEDWEEGWEATFVAISGLKRRDLLKKVMIRGESHTVIEAIHRQVAHYAYHVGQIAWIGRQLCGEE